MIEPVVFQSDNVIGVRINGAVGRADFHAIAKRVEAKLEVHPKLRIYVEMPAFAGMSPMAFFEDLKLAMKHWNRFEREAIVTDEKWIQQMTTGAAKLFSSIEIKVFPTAERVAARQWIEG